MSGIFISYRREETAAYAGRLRDRLIQEFGADQVFMDVDTIDLGVDFTDVIEKAVSDVDVLLCVMGSEWISLTDESGTRRLDDPEDFVRLEVASALKRSIRIIPVLVKGAKMPSADQLPPDLSALVKRNALQLGDVRFHSDADLLVQSLQRLLNEPSAARGQHKQKAMRLGKWLAAALILFVIAGGAWYIWGEYQDDQRRIAEQRAARAAQLEAKRQAEAEAKRKAEAEARLKSQREAELEAKRQAEAEAKRQAEAKAKLKAQREAELEAKRQAGLEAKRKAEAEAKRRAKAEAQTAAGGTVAVPALRKLKGREAIALLEKSGLQVGTISSFSTGSSRPGTVYWQSEEPGARVSARTRIDIVVEAVLRAGVRHSGQNFPLPASEIIDLDGNANDIRQNFDLAFDVAEKMALTPENGAAIGRIAARPRNPKDCAALRYSRRPFPITKSSTGTWLCVKTNRGRFSAVNIGELVNIGDNRGLPPIALRISFYTWE